jgi:uncharacterized protein YbjT (DUF2867 family)
MHANHTILVTGATGTIGRPLVDLLVGEGATVRAVTRHPQATGLPAPVEIVAGDPARPATLAPFLAGVSSLLLHPRAVGDAAGELLALARERGVRRVVALSAVNVDDDLAAQPSRYTGDKNKEVEDAAVGSGLEWVSLRASAFADNALRAWGARSAPGTSSVARTRPSPRRRSTNGTWPRSAPARCSALRWWATSWS